LPRAAGARQVLPMRLRELGATVEEVITYAAVPPHARTQEVHELLQRGDVDLVTFTSSSAVHNFVAAFDGDVTGVLARALVGCIGPVTADTARGYGMQVTIQPTAYTIPAFVDTIVNYYVQHPSARSATQRQR
jgi:uroporphyrinogen III methyltransferase/synthase